MKMRLGLAGRVAGAAAIALGLTAGLAGTASAVTFIGRDVPTTVTIAPGATGAVPWTYQNTGGSGSLPSSGIQVVFTAPGSTTFAAQSAIRGQYSADGSTWAGNNVGLRNCTLSNSAATLTCEGYGLNGGNSGWPAGGYFRFSPQVTVAATAPAGTTLAPGNGTFSYTDPASGTYYTIANGTLNVATPAITPPPPPAPRPGMCLTTLNGGRTNGTNAIIYQCIANHPNQDWVIDGGKIIIADTYGTPTPMCLTIQGGSNANNTNVILYQCVTDNSGYTNQTWVIRGGMIYRKSTMGTSSATCLSSTTSRSNGGNVLLWACQSSGQGLANQTWVVQGGQIKLADTL